MIQGVAAKWSFSSLSALGALNNQQRNPNKNVSIIVTSSYDTFLLYLFFLSEYVQRA